MVELGALHADDVARDADHGAVGRHGTQNHGVCRDFGVVAHGEGAQDLCARADHHVVADGGVALALADAGAAQGGALVDQAVVSDLHGLADDDAAAVVDDKPAADLGAGVDLDAGPEPGPLGHKAGQEFELVDVQPMGDAIVDHGVYAGIEEKDLQAGARRGVIFLIGANGFQQTHSFLQGRSAKTPASGYSRGGRMLAVPL